MQEQPPSTQLLKQRIRENIIDYLEIASSADEQREYERQVPIAQVPNEMINMWEDSVDARDFDWYGPPVFSPKEGAAIQDFHVVWDKVADDTPKRMPHTVEALFGTPSWDRLMRAAEQTLAVFRERGRFSRDREEPLDVLEAGEPSGR